MAFGLKELVKKPTLENTFKFLGDNPSSAIWVACTIAAFKGVLRPVFTMRDKKSDPETRKYTAMREGLTEGIAIPVYALVPTLGSSIIKKCLYKGASKATLKAVETNVKFWGVLASTAIIPAVCNVIQPPMMNYVTNYFGNKKAKTAIAQNNPATSIGNTNKPSFSGNNPLTMKNSHRINYGMRVGS